MLPDIRAVLATVVLAIALLTVSFGVVATFRVAQDSRAGSLQADLAQRGRAPPIVKTEPGAVLIIDMPASAESNPAPVAASNDPVPEAADKEMPASDGLEASPVVAATRQAEPASTEPVQDLPPVMALAELPSAAPLAELPSAEPPMGGPLPEQIAIQPEQPARDIAATAAKNAKKAAAKKARAARIARERKAAKQARAAQARRAKEKASASSGTTDQFGGANQFGTNQFGTTFRQ